MKNLLGAFNSNWESWQNIVFIALIVLAGIFFFYIMAFLFIGNARMAKGGRRLAWHEKQMDVKRKTLETENSFSKGELEHTRKEIKDKEDAIKETETRAKEAREQLLRSEQEIQKLLMGAEMTKKELAVYQKREGTNVSEDIAVNVLTNKTLLQSKFAMEDFQDCKIPKGKTIQFTAKQVTDYIEKMQDITVDRGVGSKPSNYKVSKMTLAFVYALPDGKVRVTFKCGPAYGTKLCKYLRQNISVAKFPYGLTWFTVSNETVPCSLELVQQLIDISYRIAKLGY